MVPLKILSDGTIRDLSQKAFAQSIIDMCQKHRNDGRALAFAFILYDFTNPEISKVLNDREYSSALHTISGHYLSIYYIHSREETFGEDLDAVSGVENRALYPIKADNSPDMMLPVLKRYLKTDEEVKNPSILFFQVDADMISDYFLIKLSEERVEDSFLELKAYISSAVDRLQMISKENYGNLQPIFECLKEGVKSVRFRRVLFKRPQRFPINLLVNWIVSKA